MLLAHASTPDQTAHAGGLRPNGETLRKMIRKTYQCKSRKETDYYLRRWIAS